MAGTHNPLLPEMATVIETVQETHNIKTFRVRFDDEEKMKNFTFQPGQVGQLSVFGVGESTFVINSSPTRMDYLQFSVMKAGENTAALHKLNAGDKIGVRAPLGNWFPYEQWKGKNVFFIGGGIGIFVAYVGMLNVNLVTFTPKDTKAAGKGLATGATPGLATLNTPTLWLFLIGLLFAIVFTVLKLKGGMLLTIVITAIIGIPMGLTSMSNSVSISDTFAQLPQTFGVIFSADGFPALFSDVSKLPLVLVTIFAFSMSDTFDTLGTFIGTGRRTGIFSDDDMKHMEDGKGFSSKLDRALFADSIATSIGAICGTSNTTTYVESSAGIAAGGRTGLTSVVVSICFALSIFLSPVISAVPSAATAGVLVIVGCMMASSLKEIEWSDISEAIPAFFAAVFMALAYSISYGIAAGFITYCIVKTCKKEAKSVHPIIWIVSLLFILNFILLAVL